MFHPLGRRGWGLFMGLFMIFVLTFLFGIHTTSASAAGCSKTCVKAASNPGCPMTAKAISETGTQNAVQNMSPAPSLDSFKKEALYTCPMHPEVKEKKAGKCPQCGMSLVKEDFYRVYTCPKKECPQISAKADKCCGNDLKMTMMSKDEYYNYAQLKVEYFCPMDSGVVSDQPGKCPKCGMNLEKRTVSMTKDQPAEQTVYVCPMHPDITSDKPGTCSKCGMKLVEKKTEK
ncbi:MAG TPA: heavy metal-binding domain-containing protein [candidate division Zixibacteria bacterium]